jgi:hypothetical protein
MYPARLKTRYSSFLSGFVSLIRPARVTITFFNKFPATGSANRREIYHHDELPPATPSPRSDSKPPMLRVLR